MNTRPVAIVPLVLSACVPAGAPPAPESAAVVQPVRQPAPTPTPSGPTTFVFDGQLTQGGWIRGQAPAGTRTATLNGTSLRLDPQGRFFAAFDRDAGPSATLVARLADGREVKSPLTIAPREWNIEHIDAARLPSGPTEAFLRIRRPELARIRAAREMDHDVGGWTQPFAWPVKGRISGRFGSQRVYRGEPGSYHSGLDIAPGGGTPYVAPADGVVVLAATSPFSLEGNLLMIDHGGGLNSAFLHSRSLAVKEGDRVRQGQLLGHVGATGRATGPHLHWSLEWQGARLDPLLFLPPQ
ncbi:M23 family metallopeptidase [Tsuneonella sp. SYSU-LHT278]|uniref:M23 family metallopeptidase n=1 Tax=Tsuneonella sediminis TaxID=3416089 RepID=UPI003F7A4A9D